MNCPDTIKHIFPNIINQNWLFPATSRNRIITSSLSEEEASTLAAGIPFDSFDSTDPTFNIFVNKILTTASNPWITAAQVKTDRQFPFRRMYP